MCHGLEKYYPSEWCKQLAGTKVMVEKFNQNSLILEGIIGSLRVGFVWVAVVAIDRSVGFTGWLNGKRGFFRGDLVRFESVYPQSVGSCGLWIAKTTQFKRIAKRNEKRRTKFALDNT